MIKELAIDGLTYELRVIVTESLRCRSEMSSVTDIKFISLSIIK